jgi:hypothetical protein
MIDDATKLIWEQSSHMAKVEVVYDLDFNSTPSIILHQNDYKLMKIFSWDKISMDIDTEKNGTVLGFCVREPPMHIFLVVDRMKGGTYFTHIVMHEMLHGFGLDHVPNKESVMYLYTYTDSKNEFSEEDAIEFGRVFGVAKERVKYTTNK